MALRGLFFDFDGLILDTETVEVEAWKQIFAEYDYEFPDWIWKKMIGVSEEGTNKIPGLWLADKLGLANEEADKFEKQIRERRRTVSSMLLDDQPLQPGVLELLDRAEEEGWSKTVVSSSPRWWVTGHLDRLELLHRFGKIICGHEGLPSKPAPDLYLHALGLNGHQPTEVLALEDSPRGVEAAQAAGIYCVAIPNPLTAQLGLDHADEVWTSLLEFRLPSHLDN